MASSLEILPGELQLAVADALAGNRAGHVALCEWSCTCSFYRTLLAPYIFEIVSLKNSEDSASRLLQIARSPYSDRGLDNQMPIL
jgi:hypothetical protein